MTHDQAKRFLASPVGIREIAMGSKRAAIRVAWSACQGPSCACSELRKLTLRPASVGYWAIGLAPEPDPETEATFGYRAAQFNLWQERSQGEAPDP